jgi:Raf kinase inhibitor-like YbhB/YbcL family protein
MAALAFMPAGVAHVDAQGAAARITVTSTAFKDGDTIPLDYTGSPNAKNISPALSWSGAPASTKQFALILDDPDANFGGMPFVHWVVYKIPGSATGLPEALPAGVVAGGPLAGTIQGLSGFFSGRGRAGAPPPVPVYRGPAPPKGIPHHYHFTVYALDAPLDLQEGLTKPALLQAMAGHIVGQGEIVGVFENK